MKKLMLKRETIGILTASHLEFVHGGASVAPITIPIRTVFCPVATNICTGGPCVETITSGGTSVINPSGG